MSKRLPARVILFVMFFGVCAAHAQRVPESSKPLTHGSHVALPPEKANAVVIPRFEKPPVIDGKLDDEAWKQAAVLKDFYQVQPGDNIKPTAPTEVLLGYDAQALYIGIRAYDDPSQVRATFAKRDSVSEDDNVEILLDTFNDRRKAFTLAFNPLGVQADGILTEGEDRDYSVDIIMKSKGMITKDGYTVEVAVPFKSLRYSVGKGKLWGIHVFRTIKHANDELDSWMPLSRDVSGMLNQAGHLTGIEEIASGRMLEVIPTLTLSETGTRAPAIGAAAVRGDPMALDRGRFVNQPVDARPGLNMKLGITPSVTLDFAANPDFAEVEADQPVILANQRFPIFFPEKRPFFLEGLDIFQTPLKALHTRAIVAPDYAVKLTGKLGRETFGLLLASDKAPGTFSQDDRSDPDNLRFIDKKAYIGVLRLKHDIGEESSLGFMATTYNFIERHNHLGGLDGRFRLDEQTVFSFQVLGTTSRRFFFDPDRGDDVYRTGNGLGYHWDLTRTGRHFYYSLNGEGRTRDYRANLGFTLRTNTNYEGFSFGYNSEPKPEGRLISWSVSNTLSSNFDWQGRAQNWDSDSQLRLNFRRETFVSLSFNRGYERVFEEEFGSKRTLTRPGAFVGGPERSTRTKGVNVSAGTTPSKKYSAELSLGYTWGAFDYDLEAGPRFPRVSPAALLNPLAPFDPGPGNSLSLSGSFSFQPNESLQMTFDYTKSRLFRLDTRRLAFDDTIYSLNARYQFTRFTFVRVRVDYDGLFSNLREQFLFAWTPSPGTSVYFGYNDDLNHNGFSPFTGVPEPGFRRNSRTFFIKTSYLFRH